MTVIADQQGAVKISEVAADEAFAQLGTAESEDALTVLKQVYQLAMDGNRSIMCFSDGRIGWDGELMTFNADARFNKIILRVLGSDSQYRTLDMQIVGGLTPSATVFADLPLANGELIYVELNRSILESSGGTVILENAINGGSILAGKTVKKINLTSSSGMPKLSLDLSGNSEVLNIPLCFRYDYVRGTAALQDLMWAVNGARWKLDTILEVGGSIALSQGGAIPNFLELSERAWDAEVDTSGWRTYNDSTQYPVNGTAGTVSPTFSFTITPNPLEVLSGKGSFVLDKNAYGNLMGHGASVDFAVDKAYQRKKIIARFVYEFLSGYSMGSIGVFIIADPLGTAQLITPYQNMLAGSKGEIVSSFEPIDGVSQYRLCVHVTDNSPAPFRLIFDDVKIHSMYFVTGDGISSPQLAGFIQSWGGTSDVEGWMICDGRSLPRVSYPDLFANIGTAFGSADSASFNIPDLRGQFIRGASVTDTERFADVLGANALGVGSKQTDALQGHQHGLYADNGIAGFPKVAATQSNSNRDGQDWVGIWTGNYLADGARGTPRVSAETRPTNIAANFLIKLYNDKKNTVLSNSHVEYCSNFDHSSTATELASFSNRSFGEFMPEMVGSIGVRRVQFTRPVTISDRIWLQVDCGSGGTTWVDAAQQFPSGKTALGTYGLSFQIVPSQPAQLDIYFGNVGLDSDGTAWSTLSTWRWRVVLSANPNAVEVATPEDVGVIKMFGGGLPPQGYMLCDGSALLRSAYPNLFSVVGTNFGAADGSGLFFSLPDFRGLFPRGAINMYAGYTMGGTITGVASDNVYIPAHNFNHTGILALATGPLPTGLAVDAEYFIIVVDENTVAFAATHADALAGIKIPLTSGTTGGTVTQNIDPDIRSASGVDGSTSGVGSWQLDAAQSHAHRYERSASAGTYGGGDLPFTGGFNGAVTVYASAIKEAVPYGAGAIRQGYENRPKNLNVNFIIKY